MRLSVLSCLLLLLGASVLQAQQPHLDARFSRTEVLSGDSVLLRLTAKVPAGAELTEPILMLPSGFSAFELLRKEPWDTIKQTGSTFLLQRDFVFIAWDSARLQIPPVLLRYRLLGDTAWQRLQSRPLELSIRFPPVERGVELKPIRPIAEEPSYWRDVLRPWMLLPLLLLLWLSVRWWRAYALRQIPEVVQPEPEVLPHEYALQQLALLRENAWWKRGRVKAFHTSLSHILRKYLEDRFGIRALEQTSGEIIDQIRQLHLPEGKINTLSELLQIADLVKFAKAQPPEHFHEEALEKIASFIEETVPSSDLPAEQAGSSKEVREVGDGQ